MCTPNDTGSLTEREREKQIINERGGGGGGGGNKEGG